MHQKKNLVLVKNDIFYTYQLKCQLLSQYASKNKNYEFIRISVKFSTEKDSFKNF
jgi:hypothetical protein